MACYSILAGGPSGTAAAPWWQKFVVIRDVSASANSFDPSCKGKSLYAERQPFYPFC